MSKLRESVIIDGSTISTTDELKILGVVLDSSLTFDQHVLNTVRNCNIHLRALRHIRSSLTRDVANMMASSIIGSRIDYCNSLLLESVNRTWTDYNEFREKLLVSFAMPVVNVK